MQDTFCSFCGKAHTQVRRLVSSPDGDCYICDACVEICREIVENDEGCGRNSGLNLALPSPMELKSYLDNYIVGQETAKRAMSVAVYNHYKRVRYNLSKKPKPVVLEKSNILLIGPTGVGKTLIAKTLAQVLKVPFVCVDATSLTEAGYVGDDVESILAKLLINADYDIKRAEMGIIYIDEIDKIAKRADLRNMTRDVSGEGVQQSLLKILEGANVEVAVGGCKKGTHQDTVTMNTDNILFVCGGAFVKLESIISDRKKNKKVGFLRENAIKNVQNDVIVADLVNFGMIPEFVGRLPVVITLEKLDKAGLINILTVPKNSLIEQYKTIFSLDGVELEFSPSALTSIANKALDMGIGARGLRSVMEETMLDTMFSCPSEIDLKKVVIDSDCVEKRALPKLKYKKPKSTSVTTQAKKVA